MCSSSFLSNRFAPIMEDDDEEDLDSVDGKGDPPAKKLKTFLENDQWT